MKCHEHWTCTGHLLDLLRFTCLTGGDFATLALPTVDLQGAWAAWAETTAWTAKFLFSLPCGTTSGWLCLTSCSTDQNSSKLVDRRKSSNPATASRLNNWPNVFHPTHVSMCNSSWGCCGLTIESHWWI